MLHSLYADHFSGLFDFAVAFHEPGEKKTQMSQNAEQIAIRCESHPLILPGLLVESVKLSKIFLFRKTSSGIKQNTITLLAHEMSDEHQEILF